MVSHSVSVSVASPGSIEETGPTVRAKPRRASFWWNALVQMLGNTFSLKKQLLLSNVFNQSSSMGRSKIKRVTSKRHLFRFWAKKKSTTFSHHGCYERNKNKPKDFWVQVFFLFRNFFFLFFRNFRPKQFSRNTEPIFFRTEPECTRNRNSEISRCTEKLFFSWLVDNFTWGYRKRVEDRTPTVEKSSKQNCSKSYNTLIIMFLIF